MIAPHFSKRPYFGAEKELRAMFWDTDGRFNNTPEGLLFKVDLNELIENVYVAPFSQPWYRDIIHELIGKYGLEKKTFSCLAFRILGFNSRRHLRPLGYSMRF